jgi:hypothetical protein
MYVEALLNLEEITTKLIVINFVLTQIVAWKTIVDISLSHISVKWIMLPYELHFRPHNKSGIDEQICMKFSVHVAPLKANPKYHFLILYNKQYQRDKC